MGFGCFLSFAETNTAMANILIYLAFCRYMSPGELSSSLLRLLINMSKQSFTIQWLHCYGRMKNSCTLFKQEGFRGSIMVQTVKNLPAIQETQVWSLDEEDPLEKGKATHFSILAWRIPCTEKPGWLPSMGHKELDTTKQLKLLLYILRVDCKFDAFQTLKEKAGWRQNL